MSGMGIQMHYSLSKFREFDGPLIDIRSPSEYQKGHWPGATNIPLFSDEERALISTKTNVISVSLGERILRSDTAITVALYCISEMTS